MTITQANYLDFSNLLINELIGSVTLTIIIGWLWIAYIGTAYRFPAQVTIVFMFLWAGFIISVAYNAFLWAGIMLLISALIYGLYAKLFKN